MRCVRKFMVPREQSSDRPAWVTAAPSGSALGRPEACEPDAHACGQFVSQRSVVRSCSWARARGTGVRPEWHKGAAPRRSPVQLASGRSLPQSAARAGSRGLCSLSVSLPRSPSRLAVRPCLVHPPVWLYVPASFTLPSACMSLPPSPSRLAVRPCLLHPPVCLNREAQPRKQDVVMGAALTFPAGPGFFSSLCTWKAVLGDPSAPSVCLLSGRLLRLWFGVCFHCCNFALSFAPPFVGWRRI